MEFLPTDVQDALKGLKLSVATGWSLRAQSNRTTLLLIWEKRSDIEGPQVQYRNMRKRGPRPNRQRRKTLPISSQPAPSAPSRLPLQSTLPPTATTNQLDMSRQSSTTPAQTSSSTPTSTITATSLISSFTEATKGKLSVKEILKVIEDYSSSSSDEEPVEEKKEKEKKVEKKKEEKKKGKEDQYPKIIKDMKLQDAYNDQTYGGAFLNAVAYMGHQYLQTRKPNRRQIKYAERILKYYDFAYNHMSVQDHIQAATEISQKLQLRFPEQDGNKKCFQTAQLKIQSLLQEKG